MRRGGAAPNGSAGRIKDLKDLAQLPCISMKTKSQTDDRFQRDAAKYAAYLDTPEGRLRLDLAFANLREFLPGRESNEEDRV